MQDEDVPKIVLCCAFVECLGGFLGISMGILLTLVLGPRLSAFLCTGLICKTLLPVVTAKTAMMQRATLQPSNML